MDKCKKCGTKLVRYPFRDEDGKIIIKNLFKIDLQSLLLIIVVALMVWGYNIDTAKCDDAISNPCKFCDYSRCCIDYGKIKPISEYITKTEIEYSNINIK